MLRRASRSRRWLLVGVVGAVNGAGVGLRLDWWAAPLVAAVVVVGLLIWDQRTGQLTAWPGDQGQHRLAAAMARLERHGWAVLRAPTIPGQQPGRTEYLLVGPRGVIVLEHQVWPGSERVTTSATTGLLEVAGRPAARRTITVRAATAAVDEALSDALSDALSRDVPVEPVLAVHGLALDQPRVTAGVRLLPIADLDRAVQHGEPRLTAAHIDTVATTARRLFSSGDMS